MRLRDGSRKAYRLPVLRLTVAADGTVGPATHDRPPTAYGEIHSLPRYTRSIGVSPL